jgi:hypothetical protein
VLNPVEADRCISVAAIGMTIMPARRRMSCPSASMCSRSSYLDGEWLQGRLYLTYIVLILYGFFTSARLRTLEPARFSYKAPKGGGMGGEITINGVTYWTGVWVLR